MEIFLTCCIISRNSEATIANAIESVKAHVNEVIVLDTGSTDETVRIAQEFEAIVFHYSWLDDFSKARNVSLLHAKHGSWILIIDSDEVFSWDKSISLKEWLVGKNPETVFTFTCNHFKVSDKQLLSITHVERLFARGYYHYQRSIHETLVSNRANNKIIEICPSGTFHHYGYDESEHKDKHIRNVRLLQKAIQLDPKDGLNYRYLANEAFNTEQYTQCLHYVNKAFDLLAVEETYSRAQVHYYKIMALLQLNRIGEAEKAVRSSIEEIPDYIDLYAIAGELHFAFKQWSEAVRSYKEWEIRLEQQILLPNNCITLMKTLRMHNWIAIQKLVRQSNRNEAPIMKLALLVVHPHLEMDLEELVKHFEEKFSSIPFDIGYWSNSHDLKNSQLHIGNCQFHLVEASNSMEAAEKLSTACESDVTWIWMANERLVSEVNEDVIYSVLSNNGCISVRSYSDRIGSRSLENRLHVGKLMTEDIHIMAGAQSNNSRMIANGNPFSVPSPLVVQRPFIIALDKQALYMEAARKETSRNQVLTAFGCQRYEEVLQMEEPDEGAGEWVTFRFYRILACINLGQIEQASEYIYYALLADLDAQDRLEFIYLFGKLSQNVQINDMKSEAIDLMEESLQLHPMIETKHVLTTETDWLALIAELQWQLGKQQEAIRSWRHSLESSSYQNEGCAYRLAEAIYEHYQLEGSDKVARMLFEIYNRDSPTARSYLPPLFHYLNIPESALFFQRNSDEINKGTFLDDDCPMVSVILPVRNDTEFLFESIHSILSQTYLKLELIIVDDGSEEDIYSIANQFNHDSRLSYYRIESNGGFPYALNYGLSKAKGEMMTWISSDNKAHPSWLERMALKLSAHPNAAAVYSDYYHIDKNGLVNETIRMPTYKLNGMQNGGPSLVWRASTLQRTGNFDTSLFGIEDRDFSVRIALVGTIISLQVPLYYYRIHSSSFSSKIDNGSFGGWLALYEKLKRKWLFLNFV
ncbi:glycosyltransferase [Paenibacillus qinlingensis]|uniref:glycosyltransferase n=1 Tax=Paenibacillus qinlingensis TaxID=1837343 RepID=UPI0015635237|nr:glycosyltransferase [Paenibacillus qinlingensis]NQX59439.1 glycosyltransferase [Paenibacillus qinlingensis]